MMPPLHVVAAVANPLRWHSRIDLYRKFEQHMLDSGVKLTVVECAYGERPHVIHSPHVQHVPVRARTMVWTKENLLNIGISRLPHDWKYVAWVDADVMFRHPHWATETVHALQHYDIVQPWGECYDLGPHGEHLELHTSFCKIWKHRQPIMQGPKCGPHTPYKFAHPGYGWAATRQALEWVGGLIDTAALGASDHHMAMALIDRVGDSIHGGMTEGYKRPLYQWQKRALHHINKNISYVPGTIEHGWHGPKKSRKYVERWDVLAKWKFDPDTDLKKNVQGVIELAGNKPGMAHDIDMYLRQRDEDLNGLAS